MDERKSSQAFENISQRVVSSYIKQLSQFLPYTPENLSPSEQHDLRISQNDLYSFFSEFYQQAFNHPEIFGLPIKQDAVMLPGFSKEEKQAVSKQFKKPRVTMEYGIDFLWRIGEKGELSGGNLILAKQNYKEFLSTNPRVKLKFLQGMEQTGLVLSEQEEVFVVSSPHHPHMMLALKAMAGVCTRNSDRTMGKYLFSRCDFLALNSEYQPDVLDMLNPILSSSAYENACAMHAYLSEMSYAPSYKMGSVHDWRIQYQGNRKIKSTPFFEFEYDERQQSQLVTRIKCASTNRLVPLLAMQPAFLQADFFQYAHNCAGPSCGWCDTRAALEPSELEYDGAKRTICWWMQRQFTKIDAETVSLVKAYALLHEALLLP